MDSGPIYSCSGRSDRNLLVTLRFVFLNKRALGHLISETTDISLKWETVPNASTSILIYLMTNSQENFLSYLSYFIIKTFGFSRKKIRRSRISTIVYLFFKMIWIKNLFICLIQVLFCSKYNKNCFQKFRIWTFHKSCKIVLIFI